MNQMSKGNCFSIYRLARQSELVKLSPLDEARAAADEIAGWNEFLREVSPLTPMTEQEFNLRVDDYNAWISPARRRLLPGTTDEFRSEKYLFSAGQLAAVEVEFENGNSVIWSTAGYLAYRYDPRF